MKDDPGFSLDDVFSQSSSSDSDSNSYSSSSDSSDNDRRKAFVRLESWGYASMERHLDLNDSLDLGRQQDKLQDMLRGVFEECDDDKDGGDFDAICDSDSDRRATPVGKKKDSKIQHQSPATTTRNLIKANRMGNKNSDSRIPQELRDLPQVREELAAMVTMLVFDLTKEMQAVASARDQIQANKSFVEQQQEQQQRDLLLQKGKKKSKNSKKKSKKKKSKKKKKKKAEKEIGASGNNDEGETGMVPDETAIVGGLSIDCDPVITEVTDTEKKDADETLIEDNETILIKGKSAIAKELDEMTNGSLENSDLVVPEKSKKKPKEDRKKKKKKKDKKEEETSLLKSKSTDTSKNEEAPPQQNSSQAAPEAAQVSNALPVSLHDKGAESPNQTPGDDGTVDSTSVTLDDGGGLLVSTETDGAYQDVVSCLKASDEALADTFSKSECMEGKEATLIVDKKDKAFFFDWKKWKRDGDKFGKRKARLQTLASTIK